MSQLTGRMHVRFEVAILYGHNALGLQFKKLSKGFDIFTTTDQDYDGYYIVPAVTAKTVGHVISISGDKIIDGAHIHVMELNRANLDWCCGGGVSYIGIKKGYGVTIPKKRQIRK